MQFIEAVLAFAVTMLVLSMVCATVVELIQRAFRLREDGLKYMLGQMFDQVVSKYVVPAANQTLEQLRAAFIQRMSENRSPVGIEPNAQLKSAKVVPGAAAQTPGFQLGNIWGGRDLTALDVTEFMERLGSTDVGQSIKAKAGDQINAVLHDVAQKFDALGANARVYFEGRARFLSVMVAIVLAFVIHVNAIEIFQVFLRDPAVRAQVMSQTQDVMAQYQKLQNPPPAQPAGGQLSMPPAQPGTPPPAGAPPAQPGAGAPPTPTPQQQVEQLKKDYDAAIKNVNDTVARLNGYGIPIGWNAERLKQGHMLELVWTCPGAPWYWPLWGSCPGKSNVLVQFPLALSVVFSLLLGGLLIGLGAPFWYETVTSLTNLLKVARGTQDPPAAPAPVTVVVNAPPTPPQAGAPVGPPPAPGAVAPAGAKAVAPVALAAQTVTAVAFATPPPAPPKSIAAFTVANAAREAGKKDDAA